MSPSVYPTPDPNQMEGGWSFLQKLTAPNNNSKSNDADDVVYVHPLAKRSKLALTEKSLEMCTESLGSETGSDVATCDFPAPPLPGESARSFRARLRVREEAASLLPPPIPSISGVHVERVRVGGRLVMTAVTVGPSRACLEAERLNGRLTLRLALRCEEAYYDEGCCIFDEMEGENDLYNKYSRASTSRCNEEESRNRELTVYPKAFCVATT